MLLTNAHGTVRRTGFLVVVCWAMEQSVIRVGRRKVAVSNLEKILYPGSRFTKAAVIEYYSRVAAVLLLHFRNRPVTLVRYPDGVFKESFFEKNAPSFIPDWRRTFSGRGLVKRVVNLHSD